MSTIHTVPFIRSLKALKYLIVVGILSNYLRSGFGLAPHDEVSDLELQLSCIRPIQTISRDYTTATPNHIQTMAASFARSLRLAETNVCRQCATLQSRRTFASLSQTPKRDIRSRTTTTAASSSQTASPWASLSRRGYKTVQEAKSRARSGVRSPQSPPRQKSNPIH
jgi:hypothetical protein